MPANIVYIDDNPYNCEFVRRTFTAWGHNCVTFQSSPRAIEYICVNKPHIIMTDLQMPMMTGYEVFTILRSVPDLRNVPILAVTANVTQEILRQCQAHGFDGFYGKPIFRKDMQDMLAKYYDADETLPQRPAQALRQDYSRV
jgi:CheY-like chemotaxis protein